MPCTVLAESSRLAENADKHLREAAKFRFELDNDIFFGSDNQFSNGWNFRLHSTVYDRWEDIEPAPKWVRTFGNNFPSLQGNNLKYRTGFSVGQVINTPSDVSRTDLIEDDVPYVGLLAGQISWSAYNEQQYRSVGVTLGTIGRSSMAEQSQNVIHKLTGSDLAHGWDNQVSDELAININYARAWKVFNNTPEKPRAWDLSFGGSAAAGNVATFVDAGLALRFGKNMPGGFTVDPEIVGVSIGNDATLAPLNPDVSSIYGSLALHSRYLFHQLFTDGSLFSNRHGDWVDTRPLVAYAILGFHYERSDYATHLNWVLTSNTVNVDELENDEDKSNRFLSITVEWKI